jgi:hypothetical protein
MQEAGDSSIEAKPGLLPPVVRKATLGSYPHGLEKKGGDLLLGHLATTDRCEGVALEEQLGAREKVLWRPLPQYRNHGARPLT